MISNDRYRLDSEGTFWYSQLASIAISSMEAKLVFRSASDRYLYEFSYVGVNKVISEFSTVKYMPAMIVQELVVLRNSLYRHAFVDMTGRYLVIYADSVHFSEAVIE
jgi:hypothetical protein